MTDWIEHNGGPQPVHEDVWLEIECDPLAYSKSGVQEAGLIEWCGVIRYRILNQHLIDAARLEGTRLGLEAAHKAIVALDDVVDEAERSVLEDASMAVCALNPDTIAKEPQHD